MESGWPSGPRLQRLPIDRHTDAADLVETLIERFAENEEDELVIRQVADALGRRPARSVPVADPAKGASVPRCRECGLPGPADIIGHRNGQPGRFPVCDHCWAKANPSLDPDPLSVSEDDAAPA